MTAREDKWRGTQRLACQKGEWRGAQVIRRQGPQQDLGNFALHFLADQLGQQRNGLGLPTSLMKYCHDVVAEFDTCTGRGLYWRDCYNCEQVCKRGDG